LASWRPEIERAGAAEEMDGFMSCGLICKLNTLFGSTIYSSAKLTSFSG